MESRKFKFGTPIPVVVNIINEGHDKNPGAVVTLFINDQQIGSRKTGSIGPKQTKQVEFSLTLTRRQSENIHVRATIASSETYISSLTDVKNIQLSYVYEPQGDIGILYATVPPVHQWIAFQAYNKLLPSGNLKNELSGYLPTSSSDANYSSTWSPPSGWSDDPDSPYDPSTALIEGACEEDGYDPFG